MTAINREQIEMTMQNLCVELEHLCQVNGSFDEVDIATLEVCQMQLNQLIQRKISMLDAFAFSAVA